MTHPQLLISVRDLFEAKSAADGGVDIIDFKEPRNGPLAPVDPSVWRSAIALGKTAMLSAALGEPDSAARIASQVPPEFEFAKVGPSQTQTPQSLSELWNSLPLTAGVELVPVAYADHRSANCPDVFEILNLVVRSGRGRLLIDTFVKDGKGLTDHLDGPTLTRVRRIARAEGVWLALAGSLRLDQAIDLNDQGLTPDCFGVRGDVCVVPTGASDSHCDEPNTSRRTGEIDGDRIRLWADAVATFDRNG